MIKAVTYDLWNTLVHNRNYGEFRLPALRKALSEHGYVFGDKVVEDAYLGGFRHSGHIIRTEDHRHVEPVEIAGEVLRLLGVEDESLLELLVPMYEDAFLCDPPTLKEGVFEVLDYVRDRYKIGMISVTGVSPGRLVRGILRDHGVLDYFDELIFSDEVKLVKPNPLLFKACTTKLNVEPSNAVHIGDSYKSDVVGAIDAGMKTIWAKTRDQEQRAGYVPDVLIHSLFEVPDALRALE